MKNSIIYLGIAALSLTNVLNAKTSTDAESTINQMQVDSFKIKSGERAYYAAQDSAILSPETLIAADYAKTDIEVIAADQQIIGNTTDDGLPLFQSKSPQEKINDNNKIIDAVIPPVQPLIIKTHSSKFNVQM